MAYVALSRVKSLSGLQLSEFDPTSVLLSRSALLEVHRLRQLYRHDLPLYTVPSLAGKTSKRKLTGSVKDIGNDQAPPTRARIDHIAKPPGSKTYNITPTNKCLRRDCKAVAIITRNK